MNAALLGTDAALHEFIARATAVDATVSVVETVETLRAEVLQHCSDAVGGFAVSEGAAGMAPPNGVPGRTAGELCQVGAAVSLARLGVAESGSVLFVPDSRAERLLLLLPPLQLVVLPLVRLVSTLDEAMANVSSLVGADRQPAPYITFMTGPSRTADIERVITVGAHGPRRLHIIIVREWTDA